MRAKTRARAASAAALAAALVAPGCLEEPTLEERWTKLEILGASPTTPDDFATGDSTTVNVRARVTFRKILTGDVVAELRYSDVVDAGDVDLKAEAPELASAQDVDRILQNSVALGTSTVLVTGFDHLIREIDMSFAAVAPPAPIGVPVDSTGAIPGLFLVLYMGDAEEMENDDGTETLVIDPFLTTEREILSAGMELTDATP
jgi:hypothetical protein